MVHAAKVQLFKTYDNSSKSVKMIFKSTDDEDNNAMYTTWEI